MRNFNSTNSNISRSVLGTSGFAEGTDNYLNENLIIPYAKPYLPKNTEESLLKAFRSGMISGNGKEIQNLESFLSLKLGGISTLTVTNGSATIRLAYQALNLRAGTRVVLPGWGFHVAANIAFSMGADIEFRDVDYHSWCLELEDNFDLSDESFSGILVLIHTLGNSANLKKKKAFSENANLRIIEDSAQALFSKNGDKYLGTNFDIGTFSLHAAKTITSGEGGIVATNNTELESNMRLLRNHGMNPANPYTHILPGDNYRLSNILASLVLPQIVDLDFILKARLDVYRAYQFELKALTEITFINETDHAGFFPWGVAVRLHNAAYEDTVELRRKLKAAGIDSRPGFTSAQGLPFYKKTKNAYKSKLTNSNMLAMQTILLPQYPDLSQENIKYISDVIKDSIS